MGLGARLKTLSTLIAASNAGMVVVSPRWFVPNCISNPSFVVCRSGMAMTPALLTRMSRGFDEEENRLAKDPTLSRDARSKGIAETYHRATAKVRTRVDKDRQ